MELTDIQWEKLEAIYEKPYAGTGRPRQDARQVLNGILWVLRTGAPGRICPVGILPIKPVIVIFRNGLRKGFLAWLCKPWPKICWSEGK